MSDPPAFNAYHRWLGIPPEEQPPDHYRLLGLKRFEPDLRVIEQHGNERIRLVNGYRRAPYVKLCDQILQHIKVARACLLNPSLKSAYDRGLKPPAAEENGADLDKWFDDDFRAPAGLDLSGAVENTSRRAELDVARSQRPTASVHGGAEERTKTDIPASEPETSSSLSTLVPEDAGYEVLPPQNGEGNGEGDALGLGDTDSVDEPDSPSSNSSDSNGAESPDEEPAAKPLFRKSTTKLRAKALLGIAGGMIGLLALGIFFWTGWLHGEAKKFSEPVTRPTPPKAPVERPSSPPPAPPRNEEPVLPVAMLPSLAPKPPAEPAVSSPPIEIGVAYGTEKRYWLEWAVEEFKATREGKSIRVHLIPMGSLEGAHAIIDGDKRIHVWTPASSLYRETFVRDWQARYQGNPIAKEEALALMPMVIVMWKARYEAFAAKSPDVSLKTLWYAMNPSLGWGGIAGRPEWGRFKLGHTHPNQSNSGLMTLVLLAYAFFEKTDGLTVADVMSPKFQEFSERFTENAYGLSNSTGNMMKEMILKGPSSYDALVVYESVAIDFLESASGRWDALQIVYPKYNLWSDNPYYILNTPWTTPEHRKAAEAFLRFLMGEAAQTRALYHGFRPGNPRVAVKGAESPLTRYEKFGVKVDLPEVCRVPPAEVLDNLLQSWIRAASRRR